MNHEEGITKISKLDLKLQGQSQVYMIMVINQIMLPIKR